MLWYLTFGPQVISGAVGGARAGMLLAMVGCMAVFVVAMLVLLMSDRAAATRRVMLPFVIGNTLMLAVLVALSSTPAAVNDSAVPGWAWTGVWLALLAFVESALRQRARLAEGAAADERAAYPALHLLPYAIALAVFGLLLVAGVRDVTGPARGLIVGAVVVGVTALARQFVLLRDNDALRARLEAQACLDALTGLRNRWSWEAQARVELERADRYGHPVSLLLLDLDGFKQVNDLHGHAAGDEVLRSVGECLRTQLRGSDLPARIGGDEFVVLLPGIDAAGAEVVADKLRMRLASAVIHIGGVAVTVGASVGAVQRAPGVGLADLTALADQRMYQAKRGLGVARLAG